MRTRILGNIEKRKDRIIEWQRALTSIPAMGPENGGDGESAKANLALSLLKEMGVTDVELANCPDERVSNGVRPNIIARMPGKKPQTLWIISHLDVVPPGDINLWKTDPWTLAVDGDYVIGRGVEDNQQALVAGLLVAAELAAEKSLPDYGLGLLMVADEETSNAHGMDFILKNRPDLFKRDDFVVVPDFGNSTGDLLDVAEKGVLWLKVTIEGRQCHASTPHKGINAMIAGSDMALRVMELSEAFPAVNELFEPPASTFVPTRREANVPNVNTLPGIDVFYIDCRVLDNYSLDEVMAAVEKTGRDIEAAHGVTVKVETRLRQPTAPSTPPDSPIVRKLIRAVEEIYGVRPSPCGIGGNTVACLLRRQGLPAAVWSRVLPNFHEPNEKSSITNTIGDAKVFARLLFE